LGVKKHIAKTETMQPPSHQLPPMQPPPLL
jgi:hypothetical protein